MVAAAKLRRAQLAVEQARPYLNELEGIIRRILPSLEGDPWPWLRGGEPQRAILLLVTADRGLCGGFNGNLFRKAMIWRAQNEDRYGSIDFVVVGRRGIDFLKRRELSMVEQYPGLLGAPNRECAKKVLGRLLEFYQGGEVPEIFVLYNEFVSAMTQRVQLKRFLPLIPEGEEGARYSEGRYDSSRYARGDAEESRVDYLYEPEKLQVIEQLILEYLESQLYLIWLESAASEHGARMTAMDSATNNAGEMIGRLTLQMNRARQAAITTELMDIVNGAEAMR